MNIVRGVFKVLIGLILAGILAAVGLVLWLTLAEYRPAAVETVTATAGARHAKAQIGQRYKIATFNVGYCGLGREEDFFMDGGKGVLPGSAAEVEENASALLSALALQAGDIVLLQEVDRDSNRSYWLNQATLFSRGLSMGWAFADNYRCPFVPIPWPPLGKVESGLMTLNNLAVTEATRESLPVPFSWPMRVANLKRCLLVERMPLQDSDRELVLVNLHLEAYSSDEGRAAQMAQLNQLLKAEVNKGNYVIAGGDFNQAFPGSLNLYPIPADDSWRPGVLASDELPSGFRYVFDARVPTCRSLETPYTGDRDAVVMYVIDGFIVSDNVKVNSVETVDLNFRNADHQPVTMEFTLQ